ncbi:restriction endonuclease subunit S [Spongiibacter tropicus]|uniref:restriction endonuclease subunit S n=1 Tax=Spongiibacter tropicus TaxID=454602 RepID=UPI0035BE10F4
MRLYEPVKLSNYCEITSSKRIYAKEYIDSGVPFYRGKEVVASFSGGKVSDPLFISENRFEEIKHRFGAPEKGDLLLTSVGTIGVPYRVTGEFDFYFKDGNLTWFRKLNGVDQNFLYYWLQSPQGKAELSKCTIGAAQPAYTIERLKEISIELPPENIQRDIASVIADYDIALKNNRRRIQLLEESARLLYQEWFVHLRFPGHEQVKINDGVPEGWEKKPLKQIATLNYGKALKAEVRVPGPFPVYGSSGEVGSHEKALVKGPGVVVGRKGNVGSVYWVNTDFYPIDTVYFISAEESSLFLYHALQNVQFINTDVAVPGLNRDMAYSREILVPDDKNFQRFLSEVVPIQEQINKLQDYNIKLAQARDLLLPKLMSGELAV